MNIKQIKQFVNLLGEEVVSINNGWAKIPCVFAPYTHESGKDAHPSMSIKVVNGGSSYFNCFSCLTKGDMVTFVERLNGFTGDETYPYPELLQLIAFEDEDIKFIDFDESIPEKKVDVFPNKWLNNFLTVYNPYLKKRGISKRVAKELDIRFDYKRMRVGFPVRTFDNKLAGFQARDITGEHEVKALHLKPRDNKFNGQVWLNENLIDLDEPIILTEGLFDLAKIYTIHPNVLCSMGCNITLDKLNRINFGVGKIYTFYDRDKAGDLARQILKRFFKKRLVAHLIAPEPYHDAGEMPLVDIKELLDEYGINKMFSFS